MTPPTHHPSDALLARYAAGTLANDFSVVVASHLTFCARCRARCAQFDTLGGVLLDALPDATVPDALRTAMLAEIETARPETPTTPGQKIDPRLPTPLAGLLSQPLDDLRWHTGGPGLRFASLGETPAGLRRLFVQAQPGAALPRHSHEGEELTVILSGAYNDGIATYHAGDFSEADEETDHRPKAEPGEICLCYIVTDAPFRLTGPIGRHVNRFMNF